MLAQLDQGSSDGADAGVATPQTGVFAPVMEACGCAVCASIRESAGDGLSGVDTGKPVWSDAQVLSNLLRTNAAWSPGATITYSFRETADPRANAEVVFSPFSEIERQHTRLAFELIEDLTNLRFVEAQDDGRTTGSSDRIYLANNQAVKDGVWGYAVRWTVPNGGQRLITASEIYVSESAQGQRAWFPGGYNFSALIHEIMHALGVPHPGDYNAGEGGAEITYAANAAYAQDSRQFSVMSYFDASNTGADYATDGAAGGRWSPATPMLHDVAVLQALYGADASSRSGDTVYGYGSNADRAVYDFERGYAPVVAPADGRLIQPAPIFTIWDGGGTDRLDFSRTSQRVNLDLNPGRFSDAFDMTNNISIALGVTIENAIGGQAGDKLVGNDAANQLLGADGDDELSGRDGDDRLDGGQGRDVLYGDAGRDLVEGGAGDDRQFGQAGDDVMGGQDGNDYLDGGDGQDAMYGDAGADFLEGRAGADRIYGQDGDDLIGGQEDDDYIDGGQGRDLLFGDAGSDLIVGWIDDDRLFGQDGDDRMGGQDGDDYLDGGQGRDHLFGDAGQDLLEGREGDDRLHGQAGDDLMGGQDGDDYLDGGEGRDNLFGDAGQDFLEGREGDDRLHGQDGDDLIGGQDGQDYLEGGAGRDRLYGDGGDDFLFGGDGADLLVGGAGADRFVFTAVAQSGATDGDFIADFDVAAGDRIDLSGIDADAGAFGDQAFVLSGAFTGRAGQAVVSVEGGVSRLLLDIDGDGGADFRLDVGGAFDPQAGLLL